MSWFEGPQAPGYVVVLAVLVVAVGVWCWILENR